MLDRQHHQPAPAGAGVALIATARAAHGEVFACGKAKSLDLRTVGAGQTGTERNVEAVRTGDHPVVGVNDQDDGPVVGRQQAVEDALHFVVEAEHQAQHADRLARVVADAAGIDQRLCLCRKEVDGAEGFHVAGVGRQCVGDQRVVRLCRCRRVVQPQQDVAFGVGQHDVRVHGVLRRVFGEARAQLRPGGGQVAGQQHIARAFVDLADELPDVGVAGEETDVGGALEKIAYQDIDRDLRLGRHFLPAGAQFLVAELVEQRAGQFGESVPGPAHVGAGPGQLAQHGEVVPDRLQVAQQFAVLLDVVHVADDTRQLGIDFDVLVLGHGSALLMCDVC